MKPGLYRSIMGNQALSYGLIAASEKSGLPIFLGTYSITPASDILHELASTKILVFVRFKQRMKLQELPQQLVQAMGAALALLQLAGLVWR